MPLLNDWQRQWRQWRSLAGWERRLLARMMVLLPVVWCGLQVAGFRRLMRWSRCPIRHPAPDTPETLNYARRCAYLAQVAANRCLPAGNCLPRALLLNRWLRKRGLDSELRIGVRTGDSRFVAHAWLEVDQCPLEPGESARYSAFPRSAAYFSD